MLKRVVDYVAPFVPFSLAMKAVDVLLLSQGFGSGGDIARSGETDVFKLLTKDNPLLFDVGGHVGAYSATFMSRFPTGRVLFFEPSSTHLQLARKNLSRFDSIEFFPIALSDRTMSATLYKDEEVTALASMTKRRLDHFDIHMDRCETIECRPLDSVVEETGVEAIDLLKIDVEGHELAVLNGGLKTIAAGRIKLIQFEFGGCNLDTRTTLQDFFYFFSDHGFKLHLIQPSGRLIHLSRYSEIYEHYRTTNYLAVRYEEPA